MNTSTQKLQPLVWTGGVSRGSALSHTAKCFPPGLAGELSPNHLGLRDTTLSHDG